MKHLRASGVAISGTAQKRKLRNVGYYHGYKGYRFARDAFDAAVARYHNDRDVIRHFRDADREIPVWALFEVITLGEFGMFYSCLDRRVKTAIARDLQMPTNVDSEAFLKAMVYALKDCRNAIAHNGVVLDVRFKSGNVNGGVCQMLQSEMGIAGVDFSSITDYVLLLAYLMRCPQFSQTECKQYVSAYGDATERYRAALPTAIFSRVVNTSARGKLAAAAHFVSIGHFLPPVCRSKHGHA